MNRKLLLYVFLIVLGISLMISFLGSLLANSSIEGGILNEDVWKANVALAHNSTANGHMHTDLRQKYQDILPSLPKNFKIMKVDYFDKNTLVVGLAGSNELLQDMENHILRLYLIDIATGHSKQVLQQEAFLQEPYRLKHLNTDQLALITNSHIFLLDKEFCLVKTLQIPDKYNKGADLSTDGKKLTYATRSGVFVGQVSDGHGSDHGYHKILPAKKRANMLMMAIKPRFSPDNDKILYTLLDHEWTRGLGIVDIVDDNKYFYQIEDVCKTQWSEDGKKLIFSTQRDFQSPVKTFLLNLTSGQITAIKSNSSLLVSYTI